MTTETSWRTEWLCAVQQMQRDYRALGRDGDARNLVRLALSLEMRANESGRVSVSNTSLRRNHLGATAFRASMNNLINAGLVDDRNDVDRLGQHVYQLNTTITTKAAARDHHIH